MTKGRIGKQTTYDSFGQEQQDALTFVVGPGEGAAFRKKYPKNEIIEVPDEVQGVVATRNFILEEFAGERILVLDDDLRFEYRFPTYPEDRGGKVKWGGEKVSGNSEKLWEMIDALEDLCDEGYYFGTICENAVPPSEDSYPRSYNCRICTNVYFDLAKLPADIRYREELAFIEDFDLALDLISRGFESGSLTDFRVNQHVHEEGGCFLTRTLDIHNDRMLAFQDKWPKYVTLRTKTIKKGVYKSEDRKLTCIVRYKQCLEDYRKFRKTGDESILKPNKAALEKMKAIREHLGKIDEPVSKITEEAPKQKPKQKPKLGIVASAAGCWTTCTASPRFIEHLGEKAQPDSTFYANEGTLAHELAEEALMLGFDKEAFDDIEMAAHVKGYVDFVNSLVGPNDRKLTEQKVSLFYHKARNGYIDACIIHYDEDGNVYGVTIVDLKYGAGVSVDAKENQQMLIYVVSVLHQLKIPTKYLEEIRMVIYQPRIIGEEAVRSWEITYDRLIDESIRIQRVADKIVEAKSYKELEFAPSESACRFCDAKPFCKAHAAWLLEESPIDYSELRELNGELEDEFTVDELAAIYENDLLIRNWLKAVKEKLRELTGDGVDTGYKFVEGQKGNRTWIDEDAAEKYLARYLKKSTRRPDSLLSPAQAKKQLEIAEASTQAIEKLEALIDRADGGPTLAKLDDPRPPFIDPKTEFDD